MNLLLREGNGAGKGRVGDREEGKGGEGKGRDGKRRELGPHTYR